MRLWKISNFKVNIMIRKSLFGLVGIVCVSFTVACGNPNESPENEVENTSRQESVKEWAIVIHGGTEGDPPSETSDDELRRHEQGLAEAINIGKDILHNGGQSIDAVEAVIRYLEDDQEFNAGKGAAKTQEDKYELDAAIMDGATLKVGALTGVTTVKNPITLARGIMENSSHVFFWGSGAEKFADGMDVERVSNSYFAKSPVEDHSVADKNDVGKENFSLGTVGCVAIDKHGNIVAGTSTGGRSGKGHGRIGDSPIIGAGTYANNKTAGVSATGAGEEFIKLTVAYDISA